jgi:orotidine-5'-phosphate decarboxylase
VAENAGKFVAYYRVSTARQGKSGLGLEAQCAAVRTTLASARLHRASLVVSKMDRLTRSVAFLSRLLEAGVDVRFADLQAAAAIRKRADARAADIMPAIRALQQRGAASLHAIAAGLNAQGIATTRGEAGPCWMPR